MLWSAMIYRSFSKTTLSCGIFQWSFDWFTEFSNLMHFWAIELFHSNLWSWTSWCGCTEQESHPSFFSRFLDSWNNTFREISSFECTEEEQWCPDMHIVGRGGMTPPTYVKLEPTVLKSFQSSHSWVQNNLASLLRQNLILFCWFRSAR